MCVSERCVNLYQSSLVPRLSPRANKKLKAGFSLGTRLIISHPQEKEVGKKWWSSLID